MWKKRNQPRSPLRATERDGLQVGCRNSIVDVAVGLQFGCSHSILSAAVAKHDNTGCLIDLSGFQEVSDTRQRQREINFTTLAVACGNKLRTSSNWITIIWAAAHSEAAFRGHKPAQRLIMKLKPRCPNCFVGRSEWSVGCCGQLFEVRLAFDGTGWLIESGDQMRSVESCRDQLINGWSLLWFQRMIN